jgi:hypothetical protein
VEPLGADWVVGCGVFGATVSLPKTPKPIRKSRTDRPPKYLMLTQTASLASNGVARDFRFGS